MNQYHMISLKARTMGNDLDVLRLDPRLGKIIHKVNYKAERPKFLAKAMRAGWVNIANELSKEIHKAIQQTN